MLQDLSWREQRELQDLVSVEPVGDDRLDWHFARLMHLIFQVMGHHEEGEEPTTIRDWLLETMVLEPNDPVDDMDEDAQLDLFSSQMHAFGAFFGIEAQAFKE